MRLMAWDGRHAEKFVNLRRTEHTIGFEIPVPQANLCGTQRQTQLLFMGAKQVLGLLAFTDVRGNTAEGVGDSGLIAEGKLYREIGVESVEVRSRLLIFHRAIPLQHLHVIRAKGVGKMARKNLMIGKPDDLVCSQSKDFFESSIDEEISPAGFLDVDDGRRVVGHVLKKLLTSTQRLLSAYPLHDRLQGPRHSGHPTIGIPDRLAPSPHPVIFT